MIQLEQYLKIRVCVEVGHGTIWDTMGTSSHFGSPIQRFKDVNAGAKAQVPCARGSGKSGE